MERRSRPFAVPLLAAAVALAVLLACSGESGRGSSPTDPGPQFFLVAVGAAQNKSFLCCLRSVEVRLDGEPLETYNFPQGGGTILWHLNLDEAGEVHLVPIRPGRHELKLVIEEDSSAPARYFANGDLEVQDEAGGTVLLLELADRERQLAEGEGFSWSFRF